MPNDDILRDRHRRCPAMLLYGQRRMGKTSLLLNLARMLPTSVVPLFVDLQRAVTARGDAGLLFQIANMMTRSASERRNVTLPMLTRDVLEIDPFTRFVSWLDEVVPTLGTGTALIALDEFEALDRALSRGRFDAEDVLGTLRHIIQHHTRFKILLSGSHGLHELERWASYLVNVQTLHLTYLEEKEAVQLIERPTRDFQLNYESSARDRVLELTRGHPYLIQLLCSELIELKNRQPIETRRLARVADVEAAVPSALESGSLFFAGLEKEVPTALPLLRLMADPTTGSVMQYGRSAGAGGVDEALELASRRELIEAAGSGFRFQVELIRRWFESRRIFPGAE